MIFWNHMKGWERPVMGQRELTQRPSGMSRQVKEWGVNWYLSQGHRLSWYNDRQRQASEDVRVSQQKLLLEDLLPRG